MDKLLQKSNDILNFYFEHLKMNSIRKVFPFNGQLLCKKRETSRVKKKKKTISLCSINQKDFSHHAVP